PPEPFLSSDLHSHHQRVYETSDQSLQLLPPSISHWTPYRDVLLPAPPVHHRLHHSQQRHVHRHPFSTTHPVYPCAHLLSYSEPFPSPSNALPPRPPKIRRHFQTSPPPSHLLPPVLNLLLQHLSP